MMQNQNLAKYRAQGFGSVEGWCSEQVFEAVDLIDSYAASKAGGIMEIGVHHGKLFILLNQIVSEEHKSYAVDIFEDQHLNIDFSGGGSLQRFRDNLEAYDRHRGRNVAILQGDSTDRGFAELNAIPPGSLRIISVDGGHTVQHTLSDLILAERLVANEGVVILDDVMNHHWLGVIEGAFQYVSGNPTLLPFAMGQNKLYLAKLSHRNAYHELFRQSPLATKEVTFCHIPITAM